MPTSAIDLDPFAGSPSVISIGGVCYSLVGPSSNASGTSDFDNDYSDCSSCQDDTCPPLVSITDVTWIDPDGNPQSLSASGNEMVGGSGPTTCVYTTVPYAGIITLSFNKPSSKWQIQFGAGLITPKTPDLSPLGSYPDTDGNTSIEVS